jgi:hypothetical protein
MVRKIISSCLLTFPCCIESLLLVPRPEHDFRLAASSNHQIPADKHKRGDVASSHLTVPRVKHESLGSLNPRLFAVNPYQVLGRYGWIRLSMSEISYVNQIALRRFFQLRKVRSLCRLRAKKASFLASNALRDDQLIPLTICLQPHLTEQQSTDQQLGVLCACGCSKKGTMKAVN